MILAQLSDPHMIVGPGDGGSAESLAAGVRAVLALRPHPDAVLLSGDLADTAAPAEYERVRALLAPLPMPVHVLGGNHDDRDALRECFPVAGAPGGEYRYVAEIGGVRLVVCDSTVPGGPEGRLDVAWLEAQLGAPRVVVAMHHPPFPVGMPALDEIALGAADTAALAALLRRSPQVLRVACGHTHRAAFAVVGGCGVFSCPGVHLTARLEIGAPGYETVAEPPAFALHVVLDGTVTTHVQPIDR
ncbi:MAG TPA: metallophosphoesterase [Solirubrobacteraceae bacterium]|nr:metallophosphoesterase [Solirubrobacteraceae bacterium]